jgi:hypothetical protein
MEPSLQRALDAVSQDPAAPDLIAGYACFYGGFDHQDRAAPGQEPWSRLQGFGPAFFTKLLYFCAPGALILDNRLANAVHQLSRLPYLVAGNGRSLARERCRVRSLPRLSPRTSADQRGLAEQCCDCAGDVIGYMIYTPQVSHCKHGGGRGTENNRGAGR